MNSTAKAFLLIGSVLMVCLTALGIAALVTDDEAPAPTPVATSPAPVETTDPILEILDDVWNRQSYSDQKSLCWLFNTDPDAAFNSFNEGSEGLVPESTFMEFFSVECSNIT